jgi:hypothetical protein
MTLTDADLKRARQLAAAAPPPSPELLARLRGILSSCQPASVAPAAPQQGVISAA